jgi:hypothetical protein
LYEELDGVDAANEDDDDDEESRLCRWDWWWCECDEEAGPLPFRFGIAIDDDMVPQ